LLYKRIVSETLQSPQSRRYISTKTVSVKAKQ
jgi:hypothetical protein